MSLKLSILICAIKEREEMLINLLLKIFKQCKELRDTHIDRQGSLITSRYTFEDLEIITAMDNRGLKTGSKRNILLEMAEGEYLCYIDEDDTVADYYIEEILKGIENKVDCCSLNGIITTNGENPKFFKHYIACEKYDEVNGEYLRYPNHLNTIKSSIAKQFSFPEKNHGEDTDWATQIHNSKLLKTEHHIDKVLYHYNYISNKK